MPLIVNAKHPYAYPTYHVLNACRPQVEVLSGEELLLCQLCISGPLHTQASAVLDKLQAPGQTSSRRSRIFRGIERVTRMHRPRGIIECFRIGN
jgi:hypothetical protein